MFTTKIRNQWPHRKTHTRVEYSAGLVARENLPSQPSLLNSPSATSTSSNLDSLYSHNLASPFLSRPSRKMSLEFANLLQSTHDLVTDNSNGAACSTTIMPLPAARLIIRPHTSRVFCVLQPDTLLAMYAAKDDAKSCDSVILLGTRLLYLFRLGRQSRDSISSTRDSVSSLRTYNSSNGDAKSLPSTSNGNSPRVSVPENKFVMENSSVEFHKRANVMKTPLASISPSLALRRAEEKENDLSESDAGSNHDSLKNSEDSSNSSPIVPLTPNGKLETHANALSVTVGKGLSSISVDTLSILSNMNGFLILPNNTDKVAHYFEAPSEELRNIWIEKIKKCVVEFDQS
nr:FYVE and Pleckstrin domain containing protein [Hymenolepis microstoma]